MRIVAFLTSCALVCMGQNPNSAAYPTSAASDSVLFVASNNASTYLTQQLNIGSTTVSVSSTTLFIMPTLISIGNEVIAVCSKTSSTFTVCASGRGYDGTTAVQHNRGTVVNGNIVRYYQNQDAAEIKAIEAVLAPGAGTNTYVLTSNGPGVAPTWKVGGGGGGGAVSSVFTRTGNVVALAGDYTSFQVGAPHIFFTTAAPGSIAGNLPGDLVSDTTNHNAYICNAPSGTSAPACTSVTSGGWELINQPAGPACIGGTAGGLCSTEGTDFTGASGIGNLNPNSTDHHWHYNNNNAGVFIMPGVSAAITAGHVWVAAANGIDLADGGTIGGTSTIFHASQALGTTAINSLACATPIVVTASGVLATDTVAWTTNASIQAVTGYAPAAAGGLAIYPPYPGSGTITINICNWSTGTITPGAVTMNLSVYR